MEAAPGASSSVADAVYRLAGSLGSELQRLSALVGSGAVAGLVAQVVRLLELLEALAQEEKPGLRRLAAAEEQDGGSDRTEGDQGAEPAAPRQPASFPPQSPAEEEEGPPRPEEGLGPAHEEHAPPPAQPASALRTEGEREVLLRLKAVVDRQRDEIRAQAHEIRCKARDAEALQEQLERFMAVNQELRRKLAVAQAQLHSAVERRPGLLEGDLRRAQRRRRRSGDAQPQAEEEEEEEGRPASSGDRGPAWNAFSREELRQILQERNELKTSLFLVQEELAYYQRELLNEGRIPSLLLEAVKATVRRQRKKIRAKMLGTVEEPLGSEEEEEEEEEGEWLSGTPSGSSDCVDSRLPGSRIKSFFGQWYRRGSKGAPPDEGGPWEIVDPQELGLPTEEEEKEEEKEEAGGPVRASSSPPRGAPALP